ncbi:ABC transporter permease [Oceanirhabdus sp. W0125-5]|uniref:ABC transporter permease n=1 Tax=Oceanirhabdus sp. W0125-5 TaxID=2999116 RepID=UPI0022F2C08B|nr:ABC transporter permease [Oceanirhabdus sp. W0125-5]WBW97208.1 ABC transporter permease [Oceanirhabdus sp. W0125-5]
MLLKNVLRTFKKKIIQLSAVGIVIFLSSFIFTSMFYGINSLQEPSEKFFIDNKQEDFSIDMINILTQEELEYAISKYNLESGMYTLTNIKKENIELYYEIINLRKETFEQKYEMYSLELREYKDINFDDNNHKIRVIKNSQKINLPMIEEGKIPSKNDEIAITKIYAKKNDIKFGDILKVNGKSYKVVGNVLFPDYNLPLFGEELIIDNSMQTIGLVTDEEYEKLKGEEGFHFAGIAKQDFKENIFQKDVVNNIKDEDELNFITNIISTKNQMRSGAVYEEIRGGKAMSLGLSFMISSIGIMIVAIIIFKIIRSEKGQIGVLKALGYSNTEIAIPYTILILAISLPMLVLGYAVGKVSSVVMRDLYLEFYLLPSTNIESNIFVLITAILVPLIFVISLSMVIIRKMLSKNPIELLRAGDVEKVSKLNKLVSKLLKKCKATTKFKYSFIFSNLGKFFVFFVGIVFVSILIMFTLMSNGLFDKMTTDYYNSVAYEYEAYIDMTKELPILENGEEKFLHYPNGKYEEDSITLKGIQDNNKLHKLYNNKGKEITSKLKDGVIINKSFNMKYDKEIGDTIKVKISDREYNMSIVGISNEFSDFKVYINLSELSEMVTDNKSDEFFNGVYSKNILDEEKYLTVVNKAVILEQSQLMQNFMKFAIYMMIGSSMAIAVIVLYVLTTLTVEDKYYDISLLKVMGYNDKEVNSMILNSYFVYSIISFLISVPIAVALVNAIAKYLIVSFNMVLPLQFELWHVFIGTIIIMCTFFIGTLSAKSRINKVSLQEILKEYRE